MGLIGLGLSLLFPPTLPPQQPVRRLPDVPGIVRQVEPLLKDLFAFPQSLGKTPKGTEVRCSEEAGDFYCEHVFFLAQKAATVRGAFVVRNTQSEPLVGFLHVPADARTSDKSLPLLADRHDDTCHVLGRGIRGYANAAAPQVDGDIRILVTGFSQWSSVVDNPTGALVGDMDCIDRAMREGFGDRLLTRNGKDGKVYGNAALTYKVRLDDGSKRNVVILPQVMSVDDKTLAHKKHGIAARMDLTRAHAVISMGVHFTGRYRVEVSADDGGMKREGKKTTHDGARRATETLPLNRSLARALRGSLAPMPPPPMPPPAGEIRHDEVATVVVPPIKLVDARAILPPDRTVDVMNGASSEAREARDASR